MELKKPSNFYNQLEADKTTVFITVLFEEKIKLQRLIEIHLIDQKCF